MELGFLVDLKTGKVRSLKPADPFEGRRGYSVHELDENLDPVRLHAVCASEEKARETALNDRARPEYGGMGIKCQETGRWDLGKGWKPTLRTAQAEFPDGEDE